MSIEDTKPLHALLSPSGADRWMVCTGSVALGLNEPNSTSEYADEGTAAHWLAAWCLAHSETEQQDPVTFLDRKVEVINGVVWEGGDAPKPKRLKGHDYDIEREFVVDSEMVMHVRSYVNRIRQYAKGNVLYVEVKVPIGHITGEDDAEGTSDCVIIVDCGDHLELQVHDLKFGRGVEVKAENNRQMKLYGLGALRKLGDDVEIEFGKPITRFRAVIHQPRINDAPDEWDCSIDDLNAFAEEVIRAANTTMSMVKLVERGEAGPAEKWVNLVPGEKQCLFCNAKAICPKLGAFVAETVGADFEDLGAVPEKAHDAYAHDMVVATAGGDLEALGVKARAADLIEMWIKAVRAKVEHVLLETRNDPLRQKALGFKLVQGKKGNRKFSDANVVEQLLKKKRFKQEDIYDFTLKSPTTFEKALKKEKPKVWKELQEYIEQAPGKAHVAPLGDKREPLQMGDPADDFEAVEDDYSDIA